jgi:polyferredoxin
MGSDAAPARRRKGSVLIRRLVYVAFFLEVGLLLVVLPWSTFWERNYFAEALPVLQPFLTNNFVRGAVTGLGLVNLVAGFADLAVVFSSREQHEIPDRP